jgi:branched-chain amino acid transport system ATP-binding protein
MIMVALSVHRLSKKFGGIQALLDVSLSIQPGERRGIIGPNGAGKTTLFHIISGAIHPSSGGVFLFGADITHMPSYKRAAMGLGRTFQITSLFPGLTVLDNILLAVMAPDSAKLFLPRPIGAYPRLLARAEELLYTWRLSERRGIPVDSLSHGEQRQLEIILALASMPKLLLLDEPTAGLSPAETETVCSMLRSLPMDITMLIIEHDMDAASRLVDQVTVLNMGEVIAEGSWEQVRMNSRVKEIYLGTQH